MMTDEVGDQLTNVTRCASDEHCRSVAIALEFWGYETEKGEGFAPWLFADDYVVAKHFQRFYREQH